jgi:hypothetical protein
MLGIAPTPVDAYGKLMPFEEDVMDSKNKIAAELRGEAA